MAELQSKIVELDGCSVHYLEAGAGEVTVMLLHGMKFKATTWEELKTIDFLADLGLKVLAVDMPGFGDSPVSELSPQEVLDKFFAALSLDNVVLIGPSMGGRLALEFGIASCSALKAMVVVGAVGVEENRAKLSQIDVPVLVIWGEDDAISPIQASNILLEELENAQLVVFAGAPHPCYLEQPDNWHETLKKFLIDL